MRGKNTKKGQKNIVCPFILEGNSLVFPKFVFKGSNFIYNSMSKAKDQMKFQEDMGQHIKEYIISRSKLTSEQYDEKLRIEWYLYAAEAKKFGFTDFIIGEDCDIDEII